MKIYNIYKPLGKTPLEALQKLRTKKKISPEQSLTYAGRLDPMASGVLLILQNAAQKNKEKILNLDKTYEVEILFGFSSDSFDLLGLPKARTSVLLNENLAENLVKLYFKNNQPLLLPVPPFSSVIYKSKPLFEWARQGKISKAILPKRQMFIKNGKLLGIKTISSAGLFKTITTSIKKVSGDFRQNQILNSWRKLLAGKSGKYKILKLQIACGSGTYIRSIADGLGKKLKTGAVVYSLKRLKVGNYNIKKSIKL